MFTGQRAEQQHTHRNVTFQQVAVQVRQGVRQQSCVHGHILLAKSARRLSDLALDDGPQACQMLDKGFSDASIGCRASNLLIF